MEFTSPIYRLVTIPGKQNGLVANRFIKKGEKIFDDVPQLWCLKNCFELNSLYCLNCGLNENAVKCHGCNMVYCSSECQAKDKINGHSIICDSYNNGTMKNISALDSRGYMILAFKFYAKVAEIMMRTNGIALEIANNELHNICLADICLSDHALRSGNFTLVNEDLFNNLIAPAYYSGYAAGSMKLITDYFGTIDYLPNFTKSEIFSENFLRYLLGSFAVNNLSIYLRSKPTADDCVIGTGFYPLFSKMNHSCSSNTINAADGNTVTVNVFAEVDIAEGEELTTSYLHAPSNSMSKRQRNKFLLQYLFKCNCQICSEETESDSSDEDD